MRTPSSTSTKAMAAGRSEAEFPDVPPEEPLSARDGECTASAAVTSDTASVSVPTPIDQESKRQRGREGI